MVGAVEIEQKVLRHQGVKDVHEIGQGREGEMLQRGSNN